MRGLLVLFAAVALVGAGCGGGGGSGGTTTRAAGPPLSKQAYQAKLESIAAEVAKRLSETTSRKLTKSDVDQVVKAAHELADRLREVKPPAAVTDLHAQLVAAMDDFGDEFPGIAKKLNSAKDASAGITAFLGAPAVQELFKLRNEFKAKGYDLNLNG